MNDSLLRLLIFFCVLTALILIEHACQTKDGRRWRVFGSNIALIALASLVLRVLPGLSALAIAIWAEHAQVGAFNVVLDMLGLMGAEGSLKSSLLFGLVILMGVLILDFAVYWQHRFMHAVPLLWRLHKVHHSDTAMDVSTGFRFHPLEILLSQLWKMLVVLVFGLPVVAVLVFEVLLSVCSLFVHAGIALPVWLEKRLRHVIVTPRMHEVHHHSRWPDTDRNYSTVLSCWDKLFGSYRAPMPREKFDIGLTQYPRNLGFWEMLKLPFDK